MDDVARRKKRKKSVFSIVLLTRDLTLARSSRDQMAATLLAHTVSMSTVTSSFSIRSECFRSKLHSMFGLSSLCSRAGIVRISFVVHCCKAVIGSAPTVFVERKICSTALRVHEPVCNEEPFPYRENGGE